MMKTVRERAVIVLFWVCLLTVTWNAIMPPGYVWLSGARFWGVLGVLLVLAVVALAGALSKEKKP